MTSDETVEQPSCSGGRESRPGGIGEVSKLSESAGVTGDVRVSIWQYPEILETLGIHLQCHMYDPHTPGWVAAEQKTTQISETFYQRQNVHGHSRRLIM